MKRLALLVLSLGSIIIFQTAQKGETAHPVYGHKFTYE
jgi:hypothetical protein